MGTIKNKLFVIILILFLAIPLISLFNQGLPLTHDGRDHVARIANFYQSLSEGSIVPRWAGNLNWGYGHPIPSFLYPLPSYSASFFHFVGFSFVDSTKLVFALGFFLSGFFMYLWLSQFLRKEESIFGAILYTYAPYRFVDLYVRGAIGENFVFIWLPLILYFIYKLFKKEDYSYSVLIAISFAFLVLSHNALSLIFLPFIVFYGIFLWSKLKFKRSYILNLILSLGLGFVLSAFFWVPALLEGKYTLRNILTSGTYLNRFVDFKALIYGPWSYGQTGEFTLQLGPVHWLALIASIIVVFYFIKKRKENYHLFLAGVAYSLIAIFLMLRESNFIWKNMMILQNFQFPWRLMAIIVFSTSLLGALALSLLKGKLKTTITFVLLILLFLISINYMKPKDYLLKPDSFYSGLFASTTDTGESSPIWGTRFMEQFPKGSIQTIDGKAIIKEEFRNSVTHRYKINVTKDARILENTVYFPGWVVLNNKKPVNIEFQDPNYRGLITFNLSKGNHDIEVTFTDTRVRQVSNFVSFLGIIAVLGFFGIKLRRVIK